MDLLVKRSLRRGYVLYMTLRPSAEGGDGFPQGTPQRGQLVDDARRNGGELRSLDQAIPLQSSKCEREHPL